jgi:hypothetical protein
VFIQLSIKDDSCTMLGTSLMVRIIAIGPVYDPVSEPAIHQDECIIDPRCVERRDPCAIPGLGTAAATPRVRQTDVAGD